MRVLGVYTTVIPLPQPAVHLPAPIRSLTFHWLLHQPARTLSGINTPHIPSPVILHPPAYEDETDRGFRNVGYQNSDAGELPKRQYVKYHSCDIPYRTYDGSVITEDGKNKEDVIQRVKEAKVMFKNEKQLLCSSSLSLEMRKKLV